MKKILSVLTLMLSASFFAGCATNVGDEDLDADEAEMADEGVDSTPQATKTCQEWTPSPATCSNASNLCQDPDAPNQQQACATLTQCFKCGVEFDL